MPARLSAMPRGPRQARAWGRLGGARRTTAMLVVVLERPNLQHPRKRILLHIRTTSYCMRLRLPKGGYNAPQGEVVLMPAYGEAVMFGHEGLSKRRQQR